MPSKASFPITERYVTSTSSDVFSGPFCTRGVGTGRSLLTPVWLTSFFGDCNL